MRKLTKIQRWGIFIVTAALSPLSCLLLFSIPQTGVELGYTASWIVVASFFTLSVVSLVTANILFVRGRLFSERTYNYIYRFGAGLLLTWTLYGLVESLRRLITFSDSSSLDLLAIQTVTVLIVIHTIYKEWRKQHS